MQQLIAFFRGFFTSFCAAQSVDRAIRQSIYWDQENSPVSYQVICLVFGSAPRNLWWTCKLCCTFFVLLTDVFFKNVISDLLTGFSFVSQKASSTSVLVTFPAFRNVISASLFRAPKRGKKAEDQRRLNGLQPAQWQAGLENCFYHGTAEARLLRAGRGVFWEREHKPSHGLVGAQLWCPAGGGWFDQPGMLLFSLINQSIDRWIECLSSGVLNPSVFLMTTDEIYPFLTYWSVSSSIWLWFGNQASWEPLFTTQNVPRSTCWWIWRRSRNLKLCKPVRPKFLIHAPKTWYGVNANVSSHKSGLIFFHLL